ncbi:MAG: hypothetical protein ABIU63_02605 [Chitinophagaceae bacterium]
MKLSFISMLLLFILTACNSQQSPVDKAKAVKKAIADSPRPGTAATQAGGWTMTAKIDGKTFVASSIMPPEAAGRIVGYYKNGYIGLPNFENRWRAIGKKIKLGEDNSADLLIAGDEPVSSSNGNGEMEITKLDDQWMEASFHFTATRQEDGVSKTTAITDGFLRVAVPKK